MVRSNGFEKGTRKFHLLVDKALESRISCNKYYKIYSLCGTVDTHIIRHRVEYVNAVRKDHKRIKQRGEVRGLSKNNDVTDIG
jgi:hypothetical protein